MIHLTIDGKEIQVPEGTTVLRAAQANDIHIPTLCDHPQLAPYGGCRLCLVDVKGARTLMPSCTMPATEGMEVTTNNDKIHEARKFVLSMIFSERNHFCPFCQVSGGDCELQNSSYSEEMTHWMIQPNWSTFNVDASHPFFTHEANRCILCRRCLRSCEELVGNNTIGVEQRGASSLIMADLGVPFGESTCVSCGTCVQNCPTGAMMDNRAAYLGLEKESETIKTICTQCSVGCGVEVQIRGNNIIRINADYDNESCHGAICKNGRWVKLYEFDDAEMITTPKIRKNGELVEATWEEAMSVAADAIKKAGTNFSAVAATGLSAESLFGFKTLFADKLSGNSVVSTETSKHSAASAKVAVEKGAFEGSLRAIDTADCVITIGEDLISYHEVISFMVKRNLKNGTKLVCIDTDDSAYGNLATSTVVIKEGSEKSIVKGIIAGMAKLGLKSCDCDSCKNPDEIVKEAAEVTGVSSETILDVAYAVGTSNNPVILFGEAVASDPEATALFPIKCMADMIGATMINAKGKANSLAASQFALTGEYQPADTVVAVMADQEVEEWAEKVASANTKIIFASYVNEMATDADVLFPVCNWAQEQGHFINLEGKIQWRSQLVNAGEQVKSTPEALNLLAKELNVTIAGDWKEALTAQPASVSIK
jgi:formate dehydrogenase major subunit